MVAVVRVERWCDRHHASGEFVEGRTLTLVLDGRNVRELDLCAGCVAELLTPLAEVVGALGRRAVNEANEPLALTTRKASGKGKGTAPTTPSTSSTPAAPAASSSAPAPVAASSSADVLDLGLAAPDAVGPDERATCPVCGVSCSTYRSWAQHASRTHALTPADVFGMVCPLDGRDWGNLGAHVVKSHEGRTQLQAFLLAERLGDPHGVTAAWRERLAALADPVAS